ncbi:hypothetical protein Mgra_00007183 [Meloidogyne graminicola]|uniref:Uncharacterized protein n=1 Tax=Meloidogyne graminicola TaxID=189291 RepID=A0A8S9ZJF0_9BILA|nr:hypothetical protein Mgra_00007183 [Meloidogyne graminicola]
MPEEVTYIRIKWLFIWSENGPMIPSFSALNKLSISSAPTNAHSLHRRLQKWQLLGCSQASHSASF